MLRECTGLLWRPQSHPPVFDAVQSPAQLAQPSGISSVCSVWCGHLQQRPRAIANFSNSDLDLSQFPLTWPPACLPPHLGCPAFRPAKQKQKRERCQRHPPETLWRLGLANSVCFLLVSSRRGKKRQQAETGLAGLTVTGKLDRSRKLRGGKGKSLFACLQTNWRAASAHSGQSAARSIFFSIVRGC